MTCDSPTVFNRSGACKEIELQPIGHKGMKTAWPRAEAPGHGIFLGFDEALTEAARIAARNTLDWLSTQKIVPMDRYEAYSRRAPWTATAPRWWTSARASIAWFRNRFSGRSKREKRNRGFTRIVADQFPIRVYPHLSAVSFVYANSNFNSPSFSRLHAILSPGFSHTCLSFGIP